LNEIKYTIKSRLYGTSTIIGRLYLWEFNVKIALSDIDGTVTRSDALGHILPKFGKDWSHKGIAKFYTAIKDNGFQFMYLTSRPIG
jgi:phosphatidate phosphatase LPIN